MAKTPPNSHQRWTTQEVQQLQKEAHQNMPTRVMGIKHKRSEAAIRSKANEEGISLKPTNQRPYGTRR
jgi:hypothetical protein